MRYADLICSAYNNVPVGFGAAARLSLTIERPDLDYASLRTLRTVIGTHIAAVPVSTPSVVAVTPSLSTLPTLTTVMPVTLSIIRRVYHVHTARPSTRMFIHSMLHCDR